jgi:uncharacterized membrane protein YhaH (DUF805 family)
MDWYLYVLKHYAVFSGRANRPQYWTFTLINVVVSLVFTMLNGLTHGVLAPLYSLFIVIPSLAVQVRRLHDINRSAWWLLIVLIPVIGSIILLIFSALPGTPGPNTYGPQPANRPT